MNENKYMSWDEFKEYIRWMRKEQNRLMKLQGGSNHIMLCISLIDYNIKDWLHFTPHEINLHTGKATAFFNGTYQKINIKHLFYNERSDMEVIEL
jgi:hypothetical protein